MMKNQLQQVFNFNGEQIRTVLIDGVVWFIGNDVAKVLGYSNYRNAVVSHVDDEDKLRTQIEYAGQKREMTLINESGVYALIFGSSLPDAKKFKHWVTSEVLPKLRKGELISANQDSYLINDPIERAKQWIKEAEEREHLSLENQNLIDQRAKDKKWVDLAKSISNNPDNLMIGTLSTFLRQAGIEVGQNRLFAWLRRDGFLVKSGKRKNEPTEYSKKHGLFKSIETPYYRDGEKHFTKQTVASHKSIIYFIQKYGDEDSAGKLQSQLKLI